MVQIQMSVQNARMGFKYQKINKIVKKYKLKTALRWTWSNNYVQNVYWIMN